MLSVRILRQFIAALWFVVTFCTAADPSGTCCIFTDNSNVLELTSLKEKIYDAFKDDSMRRFMRHCHVLDHAREGDMERILGIRGAAQFEILEHFLKGVPLRDKPCLYAQAAYMIAILSFIRRNLRKISNSDERWPILAAAAIAESWDRDVITTWMDSRIDRALTFVANHYYFPVRAYEGELLKFFGLFLPESRPVNRMLYFKGFIEARHFVQFRQVLFDPCDKACQESVVRALNHIMDKEALSKSISAMDPGTLRIWRLIIINFPRNLK